MSKKTKWSRKEVTQVFELMLLKGNELFSSRHFRDYLTRDENLLANQFTRGANGNIAYRSVDFKITEDMSDESFWECIDGTPYQDLIEDNAAVGLMKMAEKLKLID